MSDQSRALFRRQGLRCTKQREVIYRTLLACKSHPTAEELHDQVRADEPGLSLATVYNTLEVFSTRGLCRCLPSVIGGGAARYDADLSDHVHLTTPDGKVLDVPDDLSERLLDGLSEELIAELERRTGLRIGRISLQLVISDKSA